MVDTITVTVNANWIYDKMYSKGDTATLPKNLVEELNAKCPGMFTATVPLAIDKAK